jgi:hypothetical protein
MNQRRHRSRIQISKHTSKIGSTSHSMEPPGAIHQCSKIVLRSTTQSNPLKITVNLRRRIRWNSRELKDLVQEWQEAQFQDSGGGRQDTRAGNARPRSVKDFNVCSDMTRDYGAATVDLAAARRPDQVNVLNQTTWKHGRSQCEPGSQAI